MRCIKPRLFVPAVVFGCVTTFVITYVVEVMTGVGRFEAFQIK